MCACKREKERERELRPSLCGLCFGATLGRGIFSLLYFLNLCHGSVYKNVRSGADSAGTSPPKWLHYERGCSLRLTTGIGVLIVCVKAHSQVVRVCVCQHLFVRGGLCRRICLYALVSAFHTLSYFCMHLRHPPPFTKHISIFMTATQHVEEPCGASLTVKPKAEHVNRE